eukprot:scaffold23079_cov131-Isochrysis_galbana.AAC.2
MPHASSKCISAGVRHGHGARGVRVRRLHTDNAPEFSESNAPMQEVLQRHQLLGAMTTSAPHNPQQNSSAERMWRTLLEPSIAKLIRAKLPASFWWYAMSDTVEVDALIPLKGTSVETPHSRFEGEKPDVTSTNDRSSRADGNWLAG